MHEIDDLRDDDPAFVSPPFPVLFLTTAKVILAAAIVLAGLAFVALIGFLVASSIWFALTK